LDNEHRRKDVDASILDFIGGRLLSPRALSLGCQSIGISRATYFRHKKKLLRQLRIEQLEKINEDGKIVKLLRQISPRELADSNIIEELLEEIEDSDETINSRGIRDLYRLCDNYRIAYYFSPQTTARFKTEEEVEAFFERKLLDGKRERRLQFLTMLYHMLDLEMEGSLWKRDLIQRYYKPLKKLAWEENDSEIRYWAIAILMRISDDPLLDLGYSIIKDTISDQDFDKLSEIVKELLVKRKPAVERRHEIRRDLNNLARENPVWKKRVETILT